MEPTTQTDSFLGLPLTWTAPSNDVVAVPPGADFVPPWVSRGVSVAGGGTLRVLTRSGHERTLPSGSLAPGRVYRLRVRKVFGDSTAAVVLWK